MKRREGSLRHIVILLVAAFMVSISGLSRFALGYFCVVLTNTGTMGRIICFMVSISRTPTGANRLL